VKIGIFSDIHKGIGATKLITVRPDVDVVAVAGDINEGAENSFVTLRAIVPEVIPIVFTMGNHEYYRRFLGEELEFAKAIAPNFNIRVLENDTTVIGPCGGSASPVLRCEPITGCSETTTPQARCTPRARG
jgi:predicted phosphodiesterase